MLSWIFEKKFPENDVVFGDEREEEKRERWNKPSRAAGNRAE
jgi:hypothetical protein